MSANKSCQTTTVNRRQEQCREITLAGFSLLLFRRNLTRMILWYKRITVQPWYKYLTCRFESLSLSLSLSLHPCFVTWLYILGYSESPILLWHPALIQDEVKSCDRDFPRGKMEMFWLIPERPTGRRGGTREERGRNAGGTREGRTRGQNKKDEATEKDRHEEASREMRWCGSGWGSGPNL